MTTATTNIHQHGEAEQDAPTPTKTLTKLAIIVREGAYDSRGDVVPDRQGPRRRPDAVLLSAAMTPDGELPSTDAVIDTSGTCCPMPVVEARKAVTSAVEIGGIVEVIATDPGARYDMPAWARNTGHELLATSEDHRTYRFWIKRTH